MKELKRRIKAEGIILSMKNKSEKCQFNAAV